MKDQSRYHACSNGNDCASPSIRNNAKGNNHQSGQQGDFDKCFHRQKYAPGLARFPALRLCFAAIPDWLIGPVAATKKPRGSCPGLLCFASLARISTSR